MQLLRILWAAPNTLIGLMVGGSGLLFGGKMQVVGGAIEFHGSLVRWLLNRVPGMESGASAMTIGHVVLGQDEFSLNWAREHEQVHVRQYERWGPFFLPAYFSCAFWLWIKGSNPYFDNPFEREAYGVNDPREEV